MSEEMEKRPQPGKVKQLLRIPLVRILGLALLIVLLIAAVAAVLSGVGQKRAKAPQDSYVYALGTEGIVDLRPTRDGLAVLRTNSLCYIDDIGIEIASHEHKYANPALRTAGRYALLFDRGGTELRLEKNAEVVTTLPFESAVTNAAVCRNGTYAYVLNAHEGFQSHFYVFSEKNKKLFEWGSASDYATALTLSEDGKKAVLVTFTAENAEIASRVIAFDFSKKEALFSVEMKKATVFAVRFLSGGSIAVFADNGLYTVEKDGALAAVREYSAAEINHTAVEEGALSALALNLYGNDHNGEITVYDRRLRPVAVYTGSLPVTALASDSRHVAVAAGNRLQILSKSGAVRTVLLEEMCRKCVLKNNTAFVLTPGGVRAYDVAAADTDTPFLEKQEPAEGRE